MVWIREEVAVAMPDQQATTTGHRQADENEKYGLQIWRQAGLTNGLVEAGEYGAGNHPERKKGNAQDDPGS